MILNDNIRMRGDSMSNRPLAGRYLFKSRLGAGAMGVVFAGVDIREERRVAIKQLLAADANAEVRERFEREAKIMMAIRHTNIIDVYDFIEEDGKWFLVMEYIEGSILDRWYEQIRALRHGQHKKAGITDKKVFPVLGTRDDAATKEFLTIMLKVCRALAFVHSKGVIHRDIKPENIFLTKKVEPKIGDFGLAKSKRDRGMETMVGSLIGTPFYMSPEQAAGKTFEIDHTCDIWAIGAIMYRFFTDEFPFTGTNPNEILKKIQSEEPMRPRTINENLDGELELILLTALKKDKLQRYRDADDLADDIDRYIKGMKVRAKPAAVFKRTARAFKRDRTLQVSGTLAAALLIALTAFGIVSWNRWQDEKYERLLAQSYEAADAARDAGRVSDAIRIIHEAQKMAPDYFGVYLKLAELYREAGDSKRARENAELSLGMRRTFKATVLLARIYDDTYHFTGDPSHKKQSLQYFADAHGIDSSQPEICLRYYQFLGLKKADAALKKFDSLDETTKAGVPGRIVRAGMLLAARRRDEAESACRQILGEKELPAVERFETLMIFAAALDEQGKSEEAIEILRPLCRGDIPYRPALVRFAEMLRDRDRGEYVKTLRKYVGLNPDTEIAKAFVREIEEASRGVARSAPVSEVSEVSNKTKPSTTAEEVLKKLSERNYAAAEDDVRMLLGISYDDPFLNWLLWRLLLKKARETRASDLYARYLKDSGFRYRYWKRGQQQGFFDPASPEFIDPFPSGDAIWKKIPKS